MHVTAMEVILVKQMGGQRLSDLLLQLDKPASGGMLVYSASIKWSCGILKLSVGLSLTTVSGQALYIILPINCTVLQFSFVAYHVMLLFFPVPVSEEQKLVYSNSCIYI